MPLPDLTFRNDGDWGTGKGAKLTSTEGDDNIWNLHSRVLVLEQDQPEAISISDFIIEGNLLTIVLSDNSTRGPFVLPAGQWQWFGEWQSGTMLLANYVITKDGAIYLVLVTHTSAVTFDPGQVTGSDQTYQLLLAKPDQPYDMAFYIEGLIPAAQPLGIHVACRRFSVTDDFTGSIARLRTVAAADMTIPIYRDDGSGPVEVATILFPAGDNEGIIVAVNTYTPVAWDRGDELIIGPLVGTADVSAAGFACTISSVVSVL
jgi:hypothetical protein